MNFQFSNANSTRPNSTSKNVFPHNRCGRDFPKRPTERLARPSQSSVETGSMIKISPQAVTRY